MELRIALVGDFDPGVVAHRAIRRAIELAAAEADVAAGDVRAVELDDHPFFVATLFQPERAALAGVTPPVVSAFVTSIAHSVRTVAP